MDLLVHDTRTDRPMAVRRQRGRPLALYVCGPTVYDDAHVGHARNYLFFDMARRFLEAEGVPVHHVMNFTDFEDKIDARAEKLGVPWRALARREERRFLRDLTALNVLRPHECPRATENVARMTRVAQRLEATGRVRREGNEWIYTPPVHPPGTNFATDRQLARHAVREPGHPFPERPQEAGEFMIWRLQDPPRPSWPSPWGPGFPGWHLECYAMADHLLGMPVDLHGGGPDLIYPHHFAENEVALALDGTRFSRVFLHPKFLLIEGAKMSKSVGRLVPLRDALRDVGPGALRWYLLSKGPSHALKWEPRALRAAAKEYAIVRETIRRWVGRGAGGRGTAASVHRLAEEVRRALARCLATDKAFGQILAWAASVRDRPEMACSARDRARARREFRAIERRTGLALL
ncbi:MAG TPA: class I tRNA ligase family protein [Thermoplasmata archaeon]|nr:class I tRNA ligase family protein [Thermoplasmata archaeon]